MRTAMIGAVLLVLGAVAIATGILPLASVGELTERVAPILGFVVAITIAAELAAAAGLFHWLAGLLARIGRGRAVVLWLLVVAFATASTVFLSLDTTAVLLTPIVVILAKRVGLNPIPFALTTVWLANTGSLLLPVSNLTNLLAEHRLDGFGPARFAAVMWLPALVAIVVPCVAIALVYRRSLFVSYRGDELPIASDRVLFWGSAIVLVLLIPALVSGVEVWIPAGIAAVILVILFLVRRRSALTVSLIPWQLVVFASGLFVVMEAAHQLGLSVWLSAVAGSGESPLALLQLSGSGLTAANLVNNLPAYLALEPVADSPLRLFAVLVGVNAGPLITPWASLATLLWHHRLVALGVSISWRKYVLLGLVVAPVTVVLATLALLVTQP